MNVGRARYLGWLSIITLAGACSDPAARTSDASTSTDVSPDADAATATDADTATASDAAPDADPDVPPTLDNNFGVVESDGDPACDNLDPSHCLFPFPSDRFRVALADGKARLALDGAGPRDADGEVMDAAAFADRDGFSPATPIIFALPHLALPAPTYVDHQPFDPDASLAPESPVVVVAAATGERVPCWLELDHFARANGVPIVFVRLARRLAFGARYVVAVRGLRDDDGALIDAPPGFAALRDQEASTTRGVHARRAHFEADVFPVLAAAGVDRGSLQLAWDFTTTSEDGATGLIRAMRDRLYELVGADGPTYTIDGVDTLDDPFIARLVRVTVDVPSFLEAPDAHDVRHVRRDAEGHPVAAGTERVALEIQIPRSVVADPGHAPVVQYGHGLFWGRAEARKDWLRETADREGFVIVATDTQGMSENEIGPWGSQLALDISQMARLAEWPAQGIMNQLAVQRLVRGRLAADRPSALTEAGALVYDPNTMHYYGNSQGGTLGASMMALTRDIPRGVLGVPGCSFSYLIHKSVGFSGFADLIHLYYPDPYEFAAVLGLVQTAFDRVEPLDLADHLRATAAPDIARTVLLQVAKEDATVDNQVSFLCGRGYGATLLEPAVRPVWGLPTAASPFSGNALTEWDFGHPDNPDPFAPAVKATDTHEDLRRLRRAQDQWTSFVRTGVTTHLCDGVCDPD